MMAFYIRTSRFALEFLYPLIHFYELCMWFFFFFFFWDSELFSVSARWSTAAIFFLGGAQFFENLKKFFLLFKISFVLI